MGRLELVEILAAMGVLTALVVLLVLLVLAARRFLAPSGEVEVLINGLQRVGVATGEKLLWELAVHGIFLPAACGGRGTCGQCRVLIRSGSQPLLPTEAAHIRRRDAAAGIRLACITTIRSPLEIEVPDELLAARRFRCTVESNESVTTFLKELALALPDDERLEFRAGEYVLLEAPAHEVRFADLEIPAKYRAEWQRYKLLELESATTAAAVRAYSLANPPSQSRRIELIVRIAPPPPYAPPATPPGQVSSYVFSLRPGDHVDVSGPFGNFHARDTDREMVMIAGGAGIAPIRSILLDQLERAHQRRIGLWYGVRNRLELCHHEEFEVLAEQHENFFYAAALSEQAAEGWSGLRGYVHDACYTQYLKDHEAPERAEYYLCGPPLMSAAVLKMLDDLGVDADSVFLDDFHL